MEEHTLKFWPCLYTGFFIKSYTGRADKDELTKT